MPTPVPAERNRRERRAARAFDIRVVIASLLAVYGAVLTVLGLTDPSEDTERAAGLHLNLWSGVGMLAVAAAFLLWTRLRPVRIPPEEDPEADPRGGGDAGRDEPS